MILLHNHYDYIVLALFSAVFSTIMALRDGYMAMHMQHEIDHKTEIAVEGTVMTGAAFLVTWNKFPYWEDSAAWPLFFMVLLIQVVMMGAGVRWLVHDFVYNIYTGNDLNYYGDGINDAASDKLIKWIASKLHMPPILAKVLLCVAFMVLCFVSLYIIPAE